MTYQKRIYLEAPDGTKRSWMSTDCPVCKEPLVIEDLETSHVEYVILLNGSLHKGEHTVSLSCLLHPLRI